jgi:hypothetical protein
LIISDCAFGGEIDALLEVSAKVNAIPVKEPEISSSTLIWFDDAALKLIHTVPFH